MYRVIHEHLLCERRRKRAVKVIMVAGQNVLYPGCARSSFLVKVGLEAKQSCGKLRRQGGQERESLLETFLEVFFLLTVHLGISLDNDQLDAHLLYFTIRPLQSSTFF